MTETATPPVMKLEDGTVIDAWTGETVESPEQKPKAKMREYQQRAIDAIRHSISTGHRRPILACPTGSGKAIMSGEIFRLAVEKGKICLFVVHRRNLVIQFAKTLHEHFGIEAGVIMAGESFVDGLQVYVTTMQTYSRRMNLDELEVNHFFIKADLLIFDEAHVSLSPTAMKILSAYQDKIILGMTATPQLGSGVGMGEFYDDIVDPVSIPELVELGYLKTVRYFAAPVPDDLDNVKTKIGDFEKKGLGDSMDKPDIVGNVVETWLRSGENRPTIVFAVNVRHGIHLQESFDSGGVSSGFLSAKSPDNEREEKLNALRDGGITVLVNVGLFVEGMDIPAISCVVLATATKVLGKYRQACGRGMRPTDDFNTLLVLDHGGNIERHGFLDEEIEWSLDGKTIAAKKKQKKKEKQPMKCRACNLVFDEGSVCPSCGTQAKVFGKDVNAAAGELKELNPKSENRKKDWDFKRRFMGALAWYCNEKGYSPGWANHSYRSAFGCWPNDRRVKNVPPIKPEGEVKNYLTYILIKKSKSYHKKATA